MNTRQPFVAAAEPEALAVDFNLHGKFTVATDKGYRVHDAANGKLLNERDFGGSVSFAANLDDSNIVGLIGGGPYPKFPPDKVRQATLLDCVLAKISPSSFFMMIFREYRSNWAIHLILFVLA